MAFILKIGCVLVGLDLAGYEENYHLLAPASSLACCARSELLCDDASSEFSTAARREISHTRLLYSARPVPVAPLVVSSTAQLGIGKGVRNSFGGGAAQQSDRHALAANLKTSNLQKAVIRAMNERVLVDSLTRLRLSYIFHVSW